MLVKKKPCVPDIKILSTIYTIYGVKPSTCRRGGGEVLSEKRK
jgi:hypothetical protein